MNSNTMAASKRERIPQHALNEMIITEYRRGRTVKSIQKEVARLTIDESRGHCLKAMSNTSFSMK